MNFLKKIVMGAIFAGVMISAASVSIGQAAETDVQTLKTTDRLVFSGDLRLRHDATFHKSEGQVGTILGKAKSAGSWEFGYFKKYLEANVTISDWTDGDFGLGGTNRTGHILWLAYAPREYLTIQGKYSMTKKLNEFISSSAPYAAGAVQYRDINRFQLDLVVKF